MMNEISEAIQLLEKAKTLTPEQAAKPVDEAIAILFKARQVDVAPDVNPGA